MSDLRQMKLLLSKKCFSFRRSNVLICYFKCFVVFFKWYMPNPTLESKKRKSSLEKWGTNSLWQSSAICRVCDYSTINLLKFQEFFFFSLCFIGKKFTVFLIDIFHGRYLDFAFSGEETYQKIRKKCCIRLLRGQTVFAWAAAMPHFLSNTSGCCILLLEECGWWPWEHGPCKLPQTGITYSQDEPKHYKWHFFLRFPFQKDFSVSTSYLKSENTALFLMRQKRRWR